MVGRRSLTTVAATALLFGGQPPRRAPATDDTLPGSDTRSCEVIVHSEADVDKLVGEVRPRGVQARRGRRHDQLNIDADAGARGAEATWASRSVSTIEDAKTRAAVNAEREDGRAEESLAATWPATACRRAASSSRASRSCRRRARPSSSAPTSSRNYAGTFLYVEAHNKATVRITPGGNAFTGPTLALSFAGADGVYGDGRPTWGASSTPIRRRTCTCTTGS